jgi:phage tail-like protein
MSNAPSAAPGVFADPYRSYNFKLVVPGLAEAHFTECTGLGVRVTPISYREGGTSQVHRIPGPVDYAEVTLRYGLTNSRQLWDWFMSGVRGAVQRQNVSIVVLDPDGATPRVQWDLIRAWASEWRGAPLDAMCTEIAIETLTLVFESLDRA